MFRSSKKKALLCALNVVQIDGYPKAVAGVRLPVNCVK